MARIRTIKPDFFKDEIVGMKLGRNCRLLFIGLWAHADDEGIGRGHPSMVKSDVFPYDDDITASDVQLWLDELQEAGRIQQYGSPDGTQRYIKVVNFTVHQYISKPQQSKFPKPSNHYPLRAIPDFQNAALAGVSDTAPIPVPNHSDTSPGGNGMEWNGMEFLLVDVSTETPTSPHPLRKDEAVSEMDSKQLIKENRLLVFNHWLQVWGKNANTKLSQDRAYRIDKAVKEYGLRAVMNCIEGYRSDPWEPRLLSSKANDIRTLLKDASNIERGLELFATSKPKVVDSEAAIEAARKRNQEVWS